MEPTILPKAPVDDARADNETTQDSLNGAADADDAETGDERPHLDSELLQRDQQYERQDEAANKAAEQCPEGRVYLEFAEPPVGMVPDPPAQVEPDPENE